MALHTKWSSGDLIFFDGTQEIFRIKNSDEGIVAGESGEGVDLTFHGDTTGAYFHFDESADLVDFHNIKVTNQDPQAQTSTGANITLTSASNRIQFLTSTGAFNLIVPTSSGAGVAGIEFKLFNTTGGACSVCEGTTGTVIATIGTGEGGIVISDNTEWRAILGST